MPNLVSIDGESQPDVFLRNILPWQLQSPVFPNIGLLMACATQSLDRGVELDQNPESLAMKARALSYINKFLSRADKSSFYLIASESIKCVINLVVMEWFWGADESMKAHVRGVKEMVHLGGGARSFMETEPVMAGIIILSVHVLVIPRADSLGQFADDYLGRITKSPAASNRTSTGRMGSRCWKTRSPSLQRGPRASTTR